MEERTKKILEFLEPYGIGEYANISPILMEFFQVKDSHDYVEMRTIPRKVWDFVYALRNAKYIKLRDRSIESLGTGNRTGGFAWLDSINVDAAIDQQGQADLLVEKSKGEKDELKESILTTNASTIRLNTLTEENIKSQNKLTTIALWIAAFSAFITLCTLLKECLKPSQPQQIQLQLIDSTSKNRELKIKDEKPISQKDTQEKKILKLYTDTIFEKP